jgi:hypothetical protein
MDRMIGCFFLVVGVVLSLNAVFVGPHGFGTGLGGVIVSLIAGIVCAACGVWILVRRRKAGQRMLVYQAPRASEAERSSGDESDSRQSLS